MDDAMQALARRAVKCKAWRWLPGMQAVRNTGTDPYDVWRMVDGPDDDALPMWCSLKGDAYVLDDSACPFWLPGHAYPDLADRATVLLIIDLVREAWGNEWAGVEPAGFGEPAAEHPVVGFAVTPPGFWRVVAWPPAMRRALGQGHTEVEALVAALEAAP